MKCLNFPSANTNLFPKNIRNPNQLFHEKTGFIPALKRQDGSVTIMLEFNQMEIEALMQCKGKFFLTFSNQGEIASINSPAFPVGLRDDLVALDEEKGESPENEKI